MKKPRYKQIVTASVKVVDEDGTWHVLHDLMAKRKRKQDLEMDRLIGLPIRNDK